MRIEEQVTGLILAGGLGRRMDNMDKGLQNLDGRAMVAHVIQRLSPQVAHLIINANRNIETYKQFALPVISDAIGEFAGPVAGLHAGLISCHTPYLVTAPCDGPFLPKDLVSRLFQALIDEDADVAIACTGEQVPYQKQAVYTLLKSSLKSHIEAYIQSGKRRMDGWHADLKVTWVHFKNEALFQNFNSQDDIDAYVTAHPTRSHTDTR